MDDNKKTVKEGKTISFADTEDIVEFDDFRRNHSESRNVDEEKDEKQEKTENLKREPDISSKQSEKFQTENSKRETENSKTENTKKQSEDLKKEIEKKQVESNKDKKDSTKPKKDILEEKKDQAISEEELKTTTLEQQELKANVNLSDQSGKKAWKIMLVGIVALLLIVYVSGTVYFYGHFYKDVTINGVTVSNMSTDIARKTLDTFYSNYTLTLETIDGEQIVLNGKDIAMDIALKQDISICNKEQKPFIWFINMWKHHEYAVEADVNWDETALSDIFDSMPILDTSNMKAPKDAYVGFEKDQFIVEKEVLGNTIIVSSFENEVKNSLTNVMTQLVLLDAGCYKLPKLYETDEALQKEADAKNVFAKNSITIQMDDLILEPGAELYDQVLEKNGENYQISKAQVKRYVDQLAKKYDTLGEDREFTTSFQNRKIEVKGSVFGYKLNCEETTEALYKALAGQKSATVDAVFENKGNTLQGENDIGDTYVEVNLSEQKVVAYKNGKKVAEGDCVSGNESAGHGTCIGLYAIQNKLSPTVLRGEKKPVTKTVTKKNKKGKKVTKTTTTYEYEYESPVTYWLQFNGGIGLHDAAGWRSSYGGSIYYYSGSHGCVNLPLDLAKTLYENFEIGDPVVVYFWDNENRK